VKKFLYVVMVAFVSMSLVGCSGGGGAGDSPSLTGDLLSTEDMAGIEASLLADRVDQAIALDADTTLSAAVLADSATDGVFQRRGRKYRGGRTEEAWQISRGDNTCQVDVIPGSDNLQLTVGLETCTVERLEDGSLKILRGNGSEIMVGPIPAAGGNSTIDVGGVSWNAVFGGEGEPLVTLTNTRSGRVLTVVESDTGDLTVSAAGGAAFRGRWNRDGELECSDGSGRSYRYRGGRQS
jgi:hypothetical protein